MDRRLRERLTFWLITLLAAGGCDGTAPAPGARDEIVYHAFDEDNDRDLFAVTVDGARSRAVRSAPGTDLDPAVSPDGARVAFVSDRDGNYEIYVISADGTGETRLTNDPGFDLQPAWSPDGQRVVFTSHRDADGWDLYTVRPDGTGLTRLTTNTAAEFSPHWSPDGTRIAVSRGSEADPGALDLYVLNRDGTTQMRLTDSRFQEFIPRWSPEGGQIAFIADTVIALQGGSIFLRAIAIVEAGGSARELLTPFSGVEMQGLTWSRDGTRIIFDQSGDLWSVDVRDKSVSQLTKTPLVLEAGPSWRRVP